MVGYWFPRTQANQLPKEVILRTLKCLFICLSLAFCLGKPQPTEAQLQLFYTISGVVTENGTPLAGVTVNAGLLGNVVTANDGRYAFSNALVTNLYVVTPSKAGYTFNPQNSAGLTVGNATANFAGQRVSSNNDVVQGQVLLNGLGLGGVTIFANGVGVAETDANGNYQINDLEDTQANLCAEMSGMIFEPLQQLISTTGGATANFVANANAAVGPPGRCASIPNANGQIDVTGQLFYGHLPKKPARNVGIKIGTLTGTTDNNGNFSFANVDSGNYRLELVDGSHSIALEGGSEAGDFLVEDEDVHLIGYLKPSLRNTQYALWNGFIDLLNIIELVNKSSNSLAVDIEFFNISGRLVETVEVNIPAHQQHDVILNNINGFERDSYGLVRLSFSHTEFTGRTAFYKYTPARDRVEFAYAIPFANTLMGRSHTTYNTFQPSRSADTAENFVANWVTIVNLDLVPHRYTLVRYNGDGQELLRRVIDIEPMGRRDIDGGHILPGRNNVGLNELIPDNLNAPYLSVANRFGYGASQSATSAPFEFALPLLAQPADESDTFVPILNQARTENWVEITNVSDSANNVLIDAIAGDGTPVLSRTISLAPKAQVHIYAASLLGSQQQGYIRLRPSQPRSLAAQSMYYFQNAQGRLLALTPTQSSEPFGRSYTGSYNTFNGMENWLAVSNISGVDESVRVIAERGSEPTTEMTIQIPAHQTKWILLDQAAQLALREDSYGPIIVRADEQGSILAHIYRLRHDSSNEVEYLMPIQVR